MIGIPKAWRPSALGLLWYGFAAWLAVGLIGYGLAVNRHHRTYRDVAGFVLAGNVGTRVALAFGYLGDTCFTIDGGGGWSLFCVKRKWSSKNVYWDIPPGTRVQMKGFAGYVAELIVNPGFDGAKNLVEWGKASGLVREELANPRAGHLFTILGFLVFPLAFGLERLAGGRIARALRSLPRLRGAR